MESDINDFWKPYTSRRFSRGKAGNIEQAEKIMQELASL